MPLTFSDEQIREITGQVLETPALIERALQQKADVVKKKQDYKDLDDAQNVYTVYYSNIIKRYHAELKYLSGTQRTDPDDSLIDPSGQLAAGNAYCPRGEPAWKPFQPKVTDMINGNPTTPFAGYETTVISAISPPLTLMKTGFTSGTADTTTTAAFVVDEVEVTDDTGFAENDTVLFISGSAFLLGTVTEITAMAPPAAKFKVTILRASGGYAGILTGATVKNFHPGFTLSQRELETGILPGEVTYLQNLKTDIDAKVAAWEALLVSQIADLTANDAPAPEAAEITAAKNAATATKVIIDTWQGYPSIGSGTSRFGTNLPALEAEMTARPGGAAARISQITTRLGSVAQSPDGSFSGTGHYYSYFNNLNMRLNLIEGTLRNHYQMGMGGEVFDQKIKVLEDILARDTATFSIAAFTVDGNNSSTIAVNQTTNFGLGDTVKVMSNTVRTLTGTILAIDNLRVTLSFDIPASYTVADKARLVKQN